MQQPIYDDEQQKEVQIYIPDSFIESYRDRINTQLEQAIADKLKANLLLSEEEVRAEIRVVDIYLRLSIPKQKKRKGNKTGKHQETSDSFIAQFLQCSARIVAEIQLGN